jgi:glycosyltransferase involved in cell wall biosynthesis
MLRALNPSGFSPNRARLFEDDLSMRIVFLDFVRWDYVVDSAYRVPLGGSQSALCYLAEALAGLGHEVYFLGNTTAPALSRGVQCLPIGKMPPNFFATFDVAIVLNGPAAGPDVRGWLRPGAKLILWTQHAHDQPAMQVLRERAVAAAFDAVAFVSGWQQQRYQDVLGVDRARSRVLRNAIAPAFAGRFTSGESIRAAKQRPVLAYTSTPFRGLDVLLKVFPAIRAQVPRAVLRVYSSMRVYQRNQERDDAEFGHLYQLCRETPGVEYIGSLPQPALAEQLTDVMVLAYPNHYAETSCISVLEAMACGCQIVTSNLGALAETTAGFARLIPLADNGPAGDDWLAYGQTFVAEVVAALNAGCAGDGATEQRLARQVEYVNRDCTWPRRAVEWSTWLQEMTAGGTTLPVGSDAMRAAAS